VFLQVFLVHIVETFKNEPSRSFPFITYSRLENNSSVTYHLREDGTVTPCQPYLITPDYRLSDSVDLNIADSKILALEVASDNKTHYRNFLKRIQESEDGFCEVMPLFTFKEQLKIHSTKVTRDDAQLLFDIFGGSARNNKYRKCGDSIRKNTIVESTMQWFFGNQLEGKEELVASAVDLLSTVIANANDISISSTMKHMTIVGNEIKEIWASKFIEVLAGVITRELETEISVKLKSIFLEYGMGNAFESFGHKILTSNKSEYTIRALTTSKKRKKENNYNDKVNFNLPIMLIRNISDVGNLPNGCYGLPIFSNFPLVDAVIQPDTLIQFTISPEKHKGAVDRLDEIRNQLSASRDEHRIIFVIPHDNRDSFKYQKNLSSISQYVTFIDPVATANVLEPNKTSSSDFGSKKSRKLKN
jgi:hypothetical protein